MATPDDRNFESEGEAVEAGLRRTVESRDMVMRSLVRLTLRILLHPFLKEKFGKLPG
jgi:hypothetical protein